MWRTSKPKDDRRNTRERKCQRCEDAPEHEEVERNEAKRCTHIGTIDLTVPVIARKGGSERVSKEGGRAYQKRFLLIIVDASLWTRWIRGGNTEEPAYPNVIFKIVVHGVLDEVDEAATLSDCTMISFGGPRNNPLGITRSNWVMTMEYSC
jgi:hypothetical protein